MPDYEIEDTVTGIKVPVTGDKPPDQQDAHELVSRELDFLKTNLYSFPGGKFILDVGPVKKTADQVDALTEIMRLSDAKIQQAQEKIKAIDAAERAYPKPEPNIKGESVEAYIARLGKWSEEYRAHLQKVVEGVSTNIPAFTDTSRSQMATSMKEGSLLILAHGGSGRKGFESDEDVGGHKFTLSNIASILGPDASAISNVVNAACYGAGFSPDDYTNAFPAIQSLAHISTNSPNTVSVGALKHGKFFDAIGTNAPDVKKWERFIGPSGLPQWFPQGQVPGAGAPYQRID